MEHHELTPKAYALTIREALDYFTNELVKKEILQALPVIEDCDTNVREIREKSNSDFVWVNNIIGDHWTPLSALKQCYKEIRNLKRALRENLQRGAELQMPYQNDDIDLYLGSTRSLEVLGNLVKTIKKNHNLPEVITNEMWEADEARSQVVQAFKDAYEDAMGAGRGATTTGYTRWAHKIGISCQQMQSEIVSFIQAGEKEPHTFEDEFKWVQKMGDKYQDAPIKAQRLKGYAPL